MLKIGFNRTDPTSRKFYYDDSQVLTSNPPKYKVTYVDNENDIDYVECSKVFYLKPANIEDYKKQSQSRLKSTPAKKTVEKTKKTEPTIAEVSNTKETLKKRGGRKKKDVGVVDTTSDGVSVSATSLPATQAVIQVDNVVGLKFEYKVLDESFENTEELQNTLNELGESGWELCGFETYRTNLFNKPTSAVCVLRKRK